MGSCEHCQRRFGESFAVCPLCGRELAFPGDQGEGWVAVAAEKNHVDAQVLAWFLEQAGVAAVVEKHGVAMYPAPDGGLELHLVLVAPEQLAEAEELLAAAERGELAITETPAGEQEV